MYTLKEAWLRMYGKEPIENWLGKMYCGYNNAASVLSINKTGGFMSAHAYNYVLEGWMTVSFNENEITYKADDLCIYSPGMSLLIKGSSKDYRGICLFVDEDAFLEVVNVRELIKVSYFPIVQMTEPKLSLPHDSSVRIVRIMDAIKDYLYLEHECREQIIAHFYNIFLLEFQNARKYSAERLHLPKRIEEILIGFMRLLPSNFIRHHDIPFYASELNITTTYLSRVVNEATGHSVMYYVNRLLMNEAIFLLNSTTMSIGEISDRLNFADSASFSKFFSRMTGKSPKNYRGVSGHRTQ